MQIWQRMNHQSGEHQQSLGIADCQNGTKLLKVDLLHRTRIPGRWSLLRIQCRHPLQRHRRSAPSLTEQEAGQPCSQSRQLYCHVRRLPLLQLLSSQQTSQNWLQNLSKSCHKTRLDYRLQCPWKRSFQISKRLPLQLCRHLNLR